MHVLLHDTSKYISYIRHTITLTKAMSATRYCMHDTTNETKWSIYNALGEIRRLTYSTINETISSEMIAIVSLVVSLIMHMVLLMLSINGDFSVTRGVIITSFVSFVMSYINYMATPMVAWSDHPLLHVV
jgi:hypothetical protein